MSSKDDNTSKIAADIYEKVMGNDTKPDYNKFLTYALKDGHEALVNAILPNEKQFDSKEKVMGLLNSFLEPQQTKKPAPAEPKTWAERVKAENPSKDITNKK